MVVPQLVVAPYHPPWAELQVIQQLEHLEAVPRLANNLYYLMIQPANGDPLVAGFLIKY